jgi:ribosomal-protein-alanine acetyltransferase
MILALERLAASAAHWSSEQYNKLVTGGIVLLAEESSRIAGFVCASALAEVWEIENIVVRPELVRRGIANQLMQALIERAKHAGVSEMLLEVRESNHPARALYEKHNFLAVGRRGMYYREPPDDAVLYAVRFPIRVPLKECH